MKITIHLDFEEVDYVALLQAANFKRKSTEDFIREAIREHLERTAVDIQLNQTRIGMGKDIEKEGVTTVDEKQKTKDKRK